MKIDYFSFLKEIEKEAVHGKNLLRKFDKINENILKNYYIFYNDMQEDLDKKIEAFIKYREFIRNENKNLKFSAQSKFESTILEEFLYHLFKNFSDNSIKVGRAKAYTNLYFSPPSLKEFKKENFIKINHKDQDMAIYKKVLLNDIEINVPIVSIECKTYLDKTMLEGSIATAEKIKYGNPHARFYIVTETYEVDYKVDPSYSRIDNIFVLRKGKNKNNPIDKDVIVKLYTEINTFLNSNWSDIQKNIENEGIIYRSNK